MSLSQLDVEHIARLARLELTGDQKKRYREQLQDILDHFAKLQKLDTDTIPPTTGGSSRPMPLRSDETRSSLDVDEVLKNTSEQSEGQFKIPPIFE